MTRAPKRPAILALADGTVFRGSAFGAEGESAGEVVFNTSLSGYQEILTDPSYRGQIVVMTAPQIGNYGVNPEDVESGRVWVEGFVVKECSPVSSNWRARQSLDQYLKDAGIVGIQGIDTRALTKHLRDSGAQEGVLSTLDLDESRLVAKTKASPGLVGRDLVRDVTCQKSYGWTEPIWSAASQASPLAGEGRVGGARVTVYDFGVKRNILRSLVSAGCRVTVVPAGTPAADVLASRPDGVVLSNGPGDPAAVTYAVEAARNLVGRVPMFGICLGHQILGLAMGGTTSKLKFGHHGGNQPVLDLATNQVTITSQNHGFTVDLDSLGGDVEATHVNLNDRTVEGLRHKTLPIFSVQYHPEASPGPHDAGYLFQRFMDMVHR
ncbi:MAG TPA: glutamine-hydrolyzing carbamoyl-phosphate synthase small subunit [Nitrospiria bacterium]|nr:glutamine-hydrolyzing carbamoyl-phosphate synthase small subunit [Nitrospiria bacterium]